MNGYNEILCMLQLSYSQLSDQHAGFGQNHYVIIVDVRIKILEAPPDDRDVVKL